MKFIGREEQLEKLNRLWKKDSASFVAISGRRRIGKSALVEEFARRCGCPFIEIAGLGPDEQMTNSRQIDNFCERLAKCARILEPKADGWAKAFDALDLAIATLGKGRKIVFLDEISWMGRYDNAFAALLKNAWDTQFSRHSNLILVVAASVSAWIQDNILRSRSFVGRISLDMTIRELPIDQCRNFWGAKAKRLSESEIVDILSVTGGVPKYLQEIDPSQSADDNIRRLCFDPDGYLFKDFDRIFDDVFDRSKERKKRIVQILAEGAASLSELAEKSNSEVNGHLSADIRDLVEAGFVSAATGLNPQTGREIREVRYRLCDNYTRFFIKYIWPRHTAIEKGLYKYLSIDRLPGWDTVMGLQFENLIINNLAMLADKIGVAGKNIESAAPYYRRATARNKGVQIDLLIQLPKALYLVEMKRRKTISAAVENEMDGKIAALGASRLKTIRTVLVYAGEISVEVEENGYFDYLIPISEMLKG